MYRNKEIIDASRNLRNEKIDVQLVSDLDFFAKYDMDKAVIQHYAYIKDRIEKDNGWSEDGIYNTDRVTIHFVNNYVPKIISAYNKKNKGTNVKTNLAEKIFLADRLASYMSVTDVGKKYNKSLTKPSVPNFVSTSKINKVEDRLEEYGDYNQTLFRALIESGEITEDEFLAKSDDEVFDLTEEYFYLDGHQMRKQLRDEVVTKLGTIETSYLAEFDEKLDNAVYELGERYEDFQKQQAIMENAYEALQNSPSEAERNEIINAINRAGDSMGLDYGDMEEYGGDFDQIASESIFTAMEENVVWTFGSRCPTLIDAVFNDISYDMEEVIDWYKENFDEYDISERLYRIIDVDALIERINEDGTRGRYIGTSDFEKVVEIDGETLYLY